MSDLCTLMMHPSMRHRSFEWSYTDTPTYSYNSEYGTNLQRKASLFSAVLLWQKQ